MRKLSVRLLTTAFALVVILPTAVNAQNLPVAVDDSYSVEEDMTLSKSAAEGVLGTALGPNDSDADGDVLTVRRLSDPMNGSLTLEPSGAFEYTPNPDFNGVDRFIYAVSDSKDGEVPATVTITVMAVNDAPVAVDDTGSVAQGLTLNVPAPGVLSNDTDVDAGDMLTVSMVDTTDPSNGMLMLNMDGSYTYTPNPGFVGVDTFTYTVTDGAAMPLTATATVTITVFPVIPVQSQLCLVINPPRPIAGQDFTVTVTIDGVPPEVPTELACAATGQGFEASVCPEGPDVAGVVAGKIGLSFQSPDDALSFQSVTLGSGGIGRSVSFPTSVFPFAVDGDDFVRFSFSIPTPPPGAPSNTANSIVNGAGAIATFTFALADGAKPFTIGIDPPHTNFPVGSTDPVACPIPSPPTGFNAGEWPVNSPSEILVVPGDPLTTVSGTVRYWNCMTSETVPATTLTLDLNPQVTGVDPIELVNNQATGTYTFNVTPNVNYQLLGGDATLGRGVYRSDLAEHFSDDPAPTDVTNAITATDVGIIMLHWNDPDGFPLDACPIAAPSCGGPIFPQQIAANVNAWKSGGDCPIDTDAGRITGQDASILQQVIAARILGERSMPLDYPLHEKNPCTTNWRFFCDVAQFGVIPLTGVDFNTVGVLIGDVNGSYTNNPTVARKPLLGTSLAVPVVTTMEARVTIPVELRNADAVIGVEARIQFNPNVLRFVRARAPVSPETGEATNHAWAMANETGTLALVATGLTQPLNGTSVIALLEFERVDPSAPRAASPILISRALADDMILKSSNGAFTTRLVARATWGEVKQLYR